MKAPEDNDIYNLFRARLTGSEMNTFSEDSWDEMEQLLSEKSRKRKVVMWPYWLSGGIAAMLLLFAGIYFLKTTPSANDRIAKLGDKLSKPIAGGKNQTTADQVVIFVAHKNRAIHHVLNPVITNDQINEEHARDFVSIKPAALAGDNKSILQRDNPGPVILDLAATNPHKAFPDSIPSLLPQTLAISDPKQVKNVVVPNKKANKDIHAFKPQLAMSVLAAPDVNGVNKISGGGQLGSNFGLQFSMQVSKRFTISSGAFYAIRPYQTSSSNYKPQVANWWATRFGNLGKPDDVTANCRVLDIPLNVNYRLMSNSGSSLMIGGGLSSYFMLNETYHFSFANSSVSPSTFEINNRNQHILGLVNLNATYERKVNSRFSVLVQPYLKLPISQIGFGQVYLKSAGVAVGLSWNINSLK